MINEGRPLGFRSPLARQYIVWTFTFGAIITLILTIIDIVNFHEAARSEAQSEMQSLLQVYAGPFGRAAWEFNVPQIEDTLGGVVESTAVAFAELHAETIEIAIGESPVKSIAESAPILFEYEGEVRRLGEVTLFVDAERIEQETIIFGLWRLSGNIVRALILVAFSYYAFNYLVNRHLVRIAATSRGETLLDPTAMPYDIDRNSLAYNKGDELDTVVAALNTMRAEIAHQFEVQKKLLEARSAELASIGDILRALNFHVAFYHEDGQPVFPPTIGSRLDPHLTDLIPRYAPDASAARALGEAAGYDVRQIEAPALAGMEDPVLYRLMLSRDTGDCWHMYGVRLRDGALAILYADYANVRKMQYQLERARKLEALGMVVASVSHDFRNILAILQNNIELMQIAGEDRQNPEHLSAIKQIIARGSLMVDRLDISEDKRTESEPARISTIFSDLRELVTTFLGSKIALETDYEEDFELLVSRKELEMALVNLVKNACEAIGDDRGQIRIRVSKTTSADIPAFEERWDIDYALVEVLDTGPGIPPNLHDRIFEPFFTTKQRSAGMGFGLWSVFSLCRKSGGTVTYRPRRANEDGAFLLYFPIAAADGAYASSSGQRQSNSSADLGTNSK